MKARRALHTIFGEGRLELLALGVLLAAIPTWALLADRAQYVPAIAALGIASTYVAMAVTSALRRDSASHGGRRQAQNGTC